MDQVLFVKMSNVRALHCGTGRSAGQQWCCHWLDVRAAQTRDKTPLGAEAAVSAGFKPDPRAAERDEWSRNLLLRNLKIAVTPQATEVHTPCVFYIYTPTYTNKQFM